MRSRLFTAALLLSMAGPAPAIDLAPLWDFNDPAGSERRFRAALATASGDDALVLQTQIARSFGLRRDFDQARTVLSAVAPQLATAGAEVRARHALEWGRSWSSATHPPDSQTDDTRARARIAYESALAIAREGRLDGLAIDALHMLAFVDTAPADQLKWAQAALEVVDTSTQPAAKRWEASLRNNLGYALHRMGHLDEALTQFRLALALREQQGDAGSVRVARWMIAWTLRGLKREDEALAMQLQLEADGDAAGQPDPYVFEELETLYRARGDEARAVHYAQKRRDLKP
jgi:tetratricopeptide (TPR) repeat protein